jgi:hypothetical protein
MGSIYEKIFGSIMRYMYPRCAKKEEEINNYTFISDIDNIEKLSKDYNLNRFPNLAHNIISFMKFGPRKEYFELLVLKGFRFGNYNDKGENELHYECLDISDHTKLCDVFGKYDDDDEVIKILVKNIDINSVVLNKKGGTCLHNILNNLEWNYYREYPRTLNRVKIICQNGIDLSVKDNKNRNIKQSLKKKKLNSIAPKIIVVHVIF